MRFFIHIRRFLLGFALFTAHIAVVAACGFLSGDSPDNANQNDGMSLELVWPEGYSYDPATMRLSSPSGKLDFSAPSYVTKVTMVISGAGMDTLTFDVPLDTLRVSTPLTVGTRRFHLLVETNIGLTFTGSATVDITPGAALKLRFPLEVNAPPVIEKIAFSNYHPKTGDTLTAEAIASDPDPDDILTYSWKVFSNSAGWVFTADGKTVSGVVKASGTLGMELTVEDGHGGVTRKMATITTFNNPPVITGVSASPQYVKPGDTVSLACLATDADNDPLNYVFSTTAGSFTGPAYSYTFQGNGDVNFQCKASDGIASTTATASVNSGQAPRNGTLCSADFNNTNDPARVSITNWTVAVDLDLSVTAPGGTKTWYGNLRPGNSTELCVDVACSTTGAGVVELIYGFQGSSPLTGPANTYTVKVTYNSDCGITGPVSYDITFATNGDCSTTGYCFSTLTGPGATACTTPPTSNCTVNGNTISVAGNTDTFTFTLQNP